MREGKAFLLRLPLKSESPDGILSIRRFCFQIYNII